MNLDYLIKSAMSTFDEISADGMYANGISANGMSANGMLADGMSAVGISANGISADGMSAVGISADGISDHYNVLYMSMIYKRHGISRLFKLTMPIIRIITNHMPKIRYYSNDTPDNTRARVEKLLVGYLDHIEFAKKQTIYKLSLIKMILVKSTY